MTIFDEALEGTSAEKAARTDKARELLEGLFEQVGVSPSEEVLVPVRDFWDLRTHLPASAQQVWANRERLGKPTPTYRLVETQLGVDAHNSYVAHAEVDKKTGGLKQVPGGDFLLFGPPLAFILVAIVLGIAGGEFLVPLFIAVAGAFGGLFVGAKLIDWKTAGNMHSPSRHWYSDEELEVDISRPVSFDGEGEELRLIRVVSLLRGSMSDMRAWNEDILSIARSGFDLDHETLNIIAQAAAIVEHGQWLAEYAEVQRVRDAIDEADIDRRIAENDLAFSELVDRVSELVSLYYAVFDLDQRMRAEEKLVSLSQDSRENGLIATEAGGSFELGQKVDATHGAYRESVELANTKLERFMASS